MPERLSEQVPQPDAAQDRVNIGGQVLLNFIPGVGPAMAAIVGSALAVQADRRTMQLLTLVTGVVDELSDRVEGLTVQSIVEDPRFLATAEKVVRAARESTDEDHRARLVRALRHAGAWSQQEKYATERMTDLLTRVGPIHIFLTRFFAEPVEWLTTNVPDLWTAGQKTFSGGTMIELFGTYLFPNNEVPPGEAARVVEELQRESVMMQTRDSFLTTNMTGNGLIEPRLTEFGRSFLTFAESDLDP